jgi:hypothetical protein
MRPGVADEQQRLKRQPLADKLFSNGNPARRHRANRKRSRSTVRVAASRRIKSWRAGPITPPFWRREKQAFDRADSACAKLAATATSPVRSGLYAMANIAAPSRGLHPGILNRA